jgi:polar amino acid transport system substrate-binding protein
VGPVLPLLVAAALGAGSADDLVYVTEDYPPENYLDGGELRGYAVDVLRAVWQRSGIAPKPIEVLPWARAFHRTRTEANHVLFAIARTPERERQFKWAGPIRRGQDALFAVDGTAIRLASVRDAGRYRVGVLIEDVGERLLVEKGLQANQLVKVRSLSQLVQMLKAGRLDLVCTSESALANLVRREPGLAFRWVALIEVAPIDIYFAFSPTTDDAVVARFQAALVAIDAERRAIIARYGLTEARRH